MLRIGIDVGGMSLKAGLIREDGTVQASRRTVLPEDWAGDGMEFCEILLRLCDALLEENGIRRGEIGRVGIALPTAASDLMDVVPFITNINVRNLPLRPYFAARWPVSLVLSNDAVSAAWGEYRFGAGRGCTDFITVTLGTGVGGGLIFQGKPHLGKNGVAGEVGHMLLRQGGLPCNCGRCGCWEQYASATALIRMAQTEMQKTRTSRLWQCCGGRPEAITGKMVFEAAMAGDPCAKAVCGCYCEAVAEGLLSLINILQPERIALGGGISQADDSLLLNPVRERLRSRSLAALGQVEETQIVKAQLGNDAGIIGAAFMPPMRSL
ncbi:MAG: ROK family protein [Candidatus Onthomonas sp.]